MLYINICYCYCLVLIFLDYFSLKLVDDLIILNYILYENHVFCGFELYSQVFLILFCDVLRFYSLLTLVNTLFLFGYISDDDLMCASMQLSINHFEIFKYDLFVKLHS